VSDLKCFRRADYVGGTNAFVNTCFASQTIVSAGTTSYEWNALFALDNFGTSGDASQNTALYAQSIKESTGQTWASVFELRDLSTNPTVSSVATEIDIWSNTTDTNNSRAILHLVAGKLPGGNGVAPVIGRGVLLGAASAAAATINTGIEFGTATWGTALIDTTAGVTFPKGIDLSTGTCSTSCFASTGFTVDGSGNVLISNTGNAGQLNVTANSNNSAMAITNTQAGGRQYIMKSVGGSGIPASSFVLVDVTGSTNPMLINSSGDLGIGSNISDNVLTGAALKLTNSTKLATFGGSINLGAKLLTSATAPTIASGGCTTGSAQSISASNGSAAFEITLGGATCGSTITLTMPAAATNWVCDGYQQAAITNYLVSTGAKSTTAVVLTNVVRTTGVAGNFTGATLYNIKCTPY
jgi:hypothetical protein